MWDLESVTGKDFHINDVFTIIIHTYEQDHLQWFCAYVHASLDHKHGLDTLVWTSWLELDDGGTDGVVISVYLGFVVESIRTLYCKWMSNNIFSPSN